MGISARFQRSIACTVALLPVLATSTLQIYAQQNPVVAPSTLGAVLQQSAQKVLTTCQSWPPKFTKDPKYQGKSLNDSHMQDGTDIITAQLGAALSIDPNVKPYEYDASFLRLLDSVGTFDPLIGNNQLLGIAQNNGDPTALSLWGTDLSIVKYDCTSMLGLLSQAGSNYAIPFFSENAAFNASLNEAINQTSTFIYGSFQSPFTALYTGDDLTKRLFAGMRALDWRLNAAAPNADQYVDSARILAISKSYAASENTSIVANVKAGVQVSVANASGSVQGSLSNALQANSSSYITFFWQPTMHKIPDVATLSTKVASVLPQFSLNTPEITKTNTITATASIAGWPNDLCNSALWTLQSGNPSFASRGLQMTASTNGTLPTCVVVASVGLSAPAIAALPSSDKMSTPQLQLKNVANSAILINLQTSSLLHYIGDPSVTVDFVPATWSVLQNAAGQKQNLAWTISGHVDVPNSRVITAISIVPGEFDCKSSGNPDLTITGVQMHSSPGVLSINGNSPTFAVDALLALQGVTPFNDDVNQTGKRTCAISGSMHVATTDVAGANPSVTGIPFHTNVVYYPNELPTQPPAAPTGLSITAGNGQCVLSWSSTKDATTYNVYRGSSGAEVQIKTGITGTSYTDIGLTNGNMYFYEVTAVDAAGESSKSLESSVVPKP